MNPLIPLINLLTAPSSDSVRANAVAMLVALGIPANQWRKGGSLSSLLTVTTTLFASVIASLVTSLLAVPFLPICPDGWLPILAYFVYGVIANPATFATGTVTLTNVQAFQYSKAAGQIVFQCSSTGMTYTNVDPVFVNAGTMALPTVVTGIVVQASSSGSAGNATAGPGVGSIDTILTAMPGVTVVNPGPIVGLDADSPALIRTKCQAAIAARSYKGPQGAYDAAILTAINPTTGQQVAINRWTVTNDPTTGFIMIFVAAPGGLPTSDDINATQANVNAVAQPMGITATVVPVSIVPLSPTPQTITVWARGAGVTDPATIQTEVEAAIDAVLAVYPIGGLAIPPSNQGYLFASYQDGIIKAADPLIFAVQGTTDRPINPGQVGERTSTTTVLVRQIP